MHNTHVTTTSIRFPGHQGLQLSGRIDAPTSGDIRQTAIFAHCFTCSKQSLAAQRVAHALAARGTAVLRFDFAGLGDSEGAFSKTSFSTNIADLVAAGTYLEETLGAPSLLVGHSFGGAGVLAASTKIPSVKAVVTIAAPSDPQHVEHLFSQKLDAIRDAGEAEVILAGRPFTITKSFLDDIAASRLQEILPNLKKALLVMHAPEDTLVGIDHAQAIYQAARHPKSFVSLAGADHLLTRAQDAEYVADIIQSWSARYVPTSETQKQRIPEGVVRVRESGDGFTQIIQTSNHQWLADEPKEAQGDDLGPAPFEFLLAALGACSTMTARIVARRKKWNLPPIEVDLVYRREASSGQEDRGHHQGQYHKITRRLRAREGIEPHMKAELLNVVNKCPVHKALSAAPDIQTAWDEPEAEDQTKPLAS